MQDLPEEKRKKNMKEEIKYFNGNKITIIDEPCDYLDDELPEEIDFSKLKRVENPFMNRQYSVVLDQDIAKHFRSAKQLNQFLRLQLKALWKIVL